MADEMDEFLETPEMILGLNYFPDDRSILTVNDFDQLCTCEHRKGIHDRYLGCKWEGGEQICSCETFVRAHIGRRPQCWCYSTPFEPEHPEETFVSTSAVQRALDSVRDDIKLLEIQLEAWGNTEDLNERVANWRFNSWRHMEEILRD